MLRNWTVKIKEILTKGQEVTVTPHPCLPLFFGQWRSQEEAVFKSKSNRQGRKRGNSEQEASYQISNSKNANYEIKLMLEILNAGNFTTKLYT